MNTLVAVGTSITYLYSVFAYFTGRAVYFESAAFVLIFVLLGDAMEEKMHANAEAALSKLTVPDQPLVNIMIIPQGMA